MAVDFNVQGPIKMEIALEAAPPAWSDFGFSDNDDLFSIEHDTRNEVLTATDQGDEPQEVVYRGLVVVVSGTLVKWDAAAAAYDKLHQPGGTVVGDAGLIGKRWVTGGAAATSCVAVRLTPLTSGVGGYQYTFRRCFFDGNSLRLFDHGNTSKKLAVQFIAIRSVTTAVIPGGQAGGDAVYERALVI